MLMITCSDLLEQIKNSSTIQTALKGVRPAVIGMIFAAALILLQGVKIHWVSALILMGGLFAILRFKVDVILVIPVAGILGILLYP